MSVQLPLNLNSQNNVQRGLSLRTVTFAGLLIFLMSVGEGMAAPTIPLYGNELGASYSPLGYFMTGYSIAYTLITVTAGNWAENCRCNGYCCANKIYLPL